MTNSLNIIHGSLHLCSKIYRDIPADYGIYIAIMLLLNKKRIYDCFRTINKMK